MLTPQEIDEIKLASRIVGGSVHPDTKEIIPRVMRLSGFVIFNVPIATMVIFMPHQTPLVSAMLQWLNQTYNAGMNYGNRNASTPYSSQDLLKGYLAAVLVSVGLAFTSRLAFAGFLSRQTGQRQIFANATIGYFSGAFAGVANLACMRQKEMKKGVNVTNKSGD